MNDEDSLPDKKPPKRQFTLLTVLLLVTAIACWASYVKTELDLQDGKVKLSNLRNIAREVQVSDPKKFYSMLQFARRTDEDRWQIHVPSGVPARVCVSTSKIKPNMDSKDLPEPDETAVLPEGIHFVAARVETTDEGEKVMVFVDDEVVIEQTHPAGWSGTGSTWNGQSHSSPTNHPLRLMWRTFNFDDQKLNEKYAEEGGPGVLLWLDAREE